MQFAYPCCVEIDDLELAATSRIAYTISYRDVMGANSGAWSWDDVHYMATDVLRAALSFYTEVGKPLPKPSPLRPGEIMVSPPPIVAAKLALYEAMREQGVSVAELAERLEITEAAAAKLIKLDYGSHIATVERALNALGLSLTIGVRPLAKDPAAQAQHEQLQKSA